MSGKGSLYNLNCVTGELLSRADTAELVIPYIRPLQIFLQAETLPATYRNMPLRELLSYMQLSQETMDNLDANLQQIQRIPTE